MSHHSSHQARSFTINYYERLPLGGGWLGDIDISLKDWKHTTSAFGGYDSATFNISATPAITQNWISEGLGRSIVLTDERLEVIWEGFVNVITVQQAGLSVSHGPLMDIANRVFAVYSGVDTSKYPPVIGVRKKTPTFNNVKSQATWGIWPKTLSLAGVTNANADLLCAMYLKEHANGTRTSNFSFSDKTISLSLQCLGWYHTLTHPYNYKLSSGTIALSTRLKQILTAQINPWISSDHSLIATNTTPVSAYEDDDQLALEQIRGFTAMGDEDNNRYLFGIYEDRKANYHLASNVIDYEIKLTDPEQKIFDQAGSTVDPWRVRPGKWIFFSDFMPGLGAPFSELAEDPRTLFIEAANFDIRAPFSVQFNGGTNSAYQNKLARLGLRGMDA